MERLNTALHHSDTSRFGFERKSSSRSQRPDPSRDATSHASEGSIVEAPRWIFLAALVYAPWAYGSTREWAVTGLTILIGAVVALWMVGCLLRRTWPQVPPVLVITTIILAAQGWFLVGNANYDYDPVTLEFIKLDPLLPWAPGTLHRSLSLQNMAQISAMLVSVCFVCETAQREAWRKRLLWTIALTGVSLVLLGLTQRFTNATAIFWGSEEMGRSFFATYRYHSNAGAFFNLVWPIVAGFTIMTFLRRSAGWKRIPWTAALILCLAATAVIASRAAAVLTVVLAIFWGAWIFREIARSRWKGITVATAAVATIVMILLIGSLAALAGLDVSVKRWSKFNREVTEGNPRLLTAQVCLDMIPEAGAWGFGPGTFQTAFPYFTHRHGEQIAGKWIHAHQDYLQTLIEWGYVGGGAWAALLFGGLLNSIARLFRHRDRLPIDVRVTHFALVTGLMGVLLHALVDFPLQIASIQLYVAVLLGVLWANRHWLREPKQRPCHHRLETAPVHAAVLAP